MRRKTIAVMFEEKPKRKPRVNMKRQKSFEEGVLYPQRSRT